LRDESSTNSVATGKKVFESFFTLEHNPDIYK
jgi:hypothetical protein